MRRQHLFSFIALAFIHSAFTSAYSSSDWESAPGWERIQPVLPTSETFYVPTAQPRLFTDVNSNEEFKGNQHSQTIPSEAISYQDPFPLPDLAATISEGGFPAARFKRQHGVETQIGHETRWSEQLTGDSTDEPTRESGARNKRYNAPNTINDGDVDSSKKMVSSQVTNTITGDPNGTPNTSTAERDQRTFLTPPPAEKSDKPDDPTTVLHGIYTECLLTLSFTCLQKKIIVLLEKLNKIQKFNILGDYLSVVRNNKYASYRYAHAPNKPSREDYDVSSNIIARAASGSQTRDESSELRAMIDESLDNYFETHVIRLKVPAVFQQVTPLGNRSVADDDASATHIDFDLEDKDEGRKHKKKGGNGKKMMAMLGMMMCYKLSMMGPMLMGLIGLKALKALILAVISLTISKMLLLKKLKSGGGGHGHGSSGYTEASASGSGWDRSLEAHNLAYNSYKPEETTVHVLLLRQTVKNDEDNNQWTFKKK